MKKIDSKKLLGLEAAPFETLTAREKAILNAANEIKGITWRRAQLNSFSV
jgi:hypothetical protein